MALVIIVDNIKINWANLYLKWFSNSWSCFSDFSLVCLILRLLTRFPWLVSPQTLNELEGRDPGPHVQHGHVHVVTLEQALGWVVKCSVVLSENQRVKNSARRSSETPQSRPAPCWAGSRARSRPCPGPSCQDTPSWPPPPCSSARGLSVQVG